MEITIEGVEKAQRVTVRVEPPSATWPRKPLPSEEAMSRKIAECSTRGLLPMWGPRGVSVYALKEGEDASAYRPIVVGDEFIGYRLMGS